MSEGLKLEKGQCLGIDHGYFGIDTSRDYDYYATNLKDAKVWVMPHGNVTLPVVKAAELPTIPSSG